MYEAEVNNRVEVIDSLPGEIRSRFAELRELIVARTTLPWGEHCTECVWPTCYSTCELYTPRVDGACRQFIDGMVRIDNEEGLNPYLLKLRFKAWAKLWAPGNLYLRTIGKANLHERLNIAVGAVSRNTPLPASLKPRLLTKVSYLRRRAAESAPPASDLRAEAFLLECYNPNPLELSLTLTVRAAGSQTRFYQTLIPLPPGYTRSRIPVPEIRAAVDLEKPFEVEIVPNGSADTLLYFGLMDFVKERAAAALAGASAAPASMWKCVVWDLDNTLWEGVLIEDGPEQIRIRSEVVDVIKEMDRRGILHSIASKNNLEDALGVLQAHGLKEYFLYPQVGWGPKSEAIAQIATRLNIGLESLAFVDDQLFEREEVRALHHCVAVVDAAEAAGLLDRPECQVPVTAESSNRRRMYQQDAQRDTTLRNYAGNYLQFLRECRLEVSIGSLNESNLTRAYELAQRTNQMNFSGNRYPEASLREIMASSGHETFLIACRDRFGDYGVVGFGLVDCDGPRLLDLMFSCRIQGKRVEHAVLAFLLGRFVGTNGRNFYADYRKTRKNEAAGQVFEQMGFETISETDGVTHMVFKAGRPIPDEEVVAIRQDIASTQPKSPRSGQN